MASDEIKVVAEKPSVYLARKVLQVKLEDMKPVYHEGSIVLVDAQGVEYLLATKQK